MIINQKNYFYENICLNQNDNVTKVKRPDEKPREKTVLHLDLAISIIFK